MNNRYIKSWQSLIPVLLGPHTFLHQLNASEVKIWPALKNSNIFHKVENVKSLYCVYCFHKKLHQMFDRVLNMIGSWMYQVFECIKVPNMVLVLNIPGFWIYPSYKNTRVAKVSEYAWLVPEFLILPEYIWVCLNMPEYAWSSNHCNPMSKATI